MYETFTIRNFRTFRDLTIGPLAQVNLIAGKNGAGKTSLLEAIFLHVGAHNPRLPLSINAFRGMDRVTRDAEEMWGWLFHDKMIDQAVELEGMDRTKQSRRLTMRLVAPTEVRLEHDGAQGIVPESGEGIFSTTAVPLELRLSYQDSDGKTGESRATIGPENVTFEGDSSRRFPNGVFVNTSGFTGQNEIERLSKLEAGNRQQEVVTALKLVDPRIRRLSVLVVAGKAMVYADIGLEKLIPFPFLGHGLGRLLAMLLAIADSPSGVVLIDEIENGIHYSAMRDVWQSIFEAAHRLNVQVFATTHSWECIHKAYEALETSDAYDLRVHRLEQFNDAFRAVTIDREALATVLKAELEIR